MFILPSHGADQTGKRKGYSPGIPFRERRGQEQGEGKVLPASRDTYDEGIHEGQTCHLSHAFLTDRYDYEEPKVDPAGPESEEEETAPYTHEAKEADRDAGGEDIGPETRNAQ